MGSLRWFIHIFMCTRPFSSHISQNSKNNQKTLFKPKPLTVPFVFSNLRDIALSSGQSVSKCFSENQTSGAFQSLYHVVTSKESIHYHKTARRMSRFRGKVYCPKFGGQVADRKCRAVSVGLPVPGCSFGRTRTM